MKPANFPARKDARRRTALTSRIAQGCSMEEQLQIQSKLNPAARAVRTKKDRRDRAKFRGTI